METTSGGDAGDGVGTGFGPPRRRPTRNQGFAERHASLSGPPSAPMGNLLSFLYWHHRRTGLACHGNPPRGPRALGRHTFFVDQTVRPGLVAAPLRASSRATLSLTQVRGARHPCCIWLLFGDALRSLPGATPANSEGGLFAKPRVAALVSSAGNFMGWSSTTWGHPRIKPVLPPNQCWEVLDAGRVHIDEPSDPASARAARHRGCPATGCSISRCSSPPNILQNVVSVHGHA